MLAYVAQFLVAIIASAIITWGVRNVARRYGLSMTPRSSRHIHATPIPRLGGLAIFAAFLTVFMLYSVVAEHGWIAAPANRDVARILMLGIAVFVIGLIDDLVGVRPWAKLLVEISGALGLYFSGIRFDFCGTQAAGSFIWIICLFATVGWVVLICNAINLIDGVDGLAAGAALFSMVTVFTMAVGSRPGVANSTVILAGSLFGFLIFNFNPASIFMGDSGSLFVGFLLSALVLSEQPKQGTNLRGIVIPLVCFALPLTDVALSLLRRFLNGHSLFGADREHIHHKLMELGLSQRQVVWTLYGVSALFSILSLILLHPSPAALLPVIALVLLTVFFGVRKLKYHEFMEVLRPTDAVLLKRKKVATNVAIRKAAACLQTTKDATAIGIILETCLKRDFDGFAILLSSPLGSRYQLPEPWYSNCLEASWKHNREKLTVTFDLTSEDGSFLGQFLLHRSASLQILARIDLIRSVLRPALVRALQNSVADASLASIVFPAVANPQEEVRRERILTTSNKAQVMSSVPFEPSVVVPLGPVSQARQLPASWRARLYPPFNK